MGSRGRLILVGLALAAIAPGPAAAAPRKLRLLHDTFSSAYRNPSGAVRTGSTVTLRLRVTGGKPKGISDDSYTEWDIGATFTYDKYSLDLRYIDTSRHILPALKAATISAVGAPAFDTGPFYVATFKFAFP